MEAGCAGFAARAIRGGRDGSIRVFPKLGGITAGAGATGAGRLRRAFWLATMGAAAEAGGFDARAAFRRLTGCGASSLVAGAGPEIHGMAWPVSFSIAATALRSTALAIVIAVPSRPARAVRPMR